MCMAQRLPTSLLVIKVGVKGEGEHGKCLVSNLTVESATLSQDVSRAMGNMAPCNTSLVKHFSFLFSIRPFQNLNFGIATIHI